MPSSLSGEIKKKNAYCLDQSVYQGGGGGGVKVAVEWGWVWANNFDLVLKVHPHFKTILITGRNLVYSPNPGI